MKRTMLPLAARLGGPVLVAALAALPLQAADSPLRANAGFSLGGGAGTNSLNGDDYTGDGNDVDDTQVSYKGLAALRLNHVVSLEAQYVDFGTAEDGGNRVKAHGVTAGGVFDVPMTRYVHPYGKAGALFWDSDGQFSNVRRSDDGIDFTYGAGVRFLLGRHFDVRTEYERFELNNNDVHTISGMLQFNF